MSTATPSTAIHKLVDAANKGVLTRAVTKLPSGWVVLGDPQVIKGYCLLLPDPVVPHLNALTGTRRTRFLDDMARVGDAVLEVTGAVRINYEMLGNLEPALHAHVLPRHADEPEELRTRPIWFYDWEKAPAFDPARDGAYMERLRQALR